MRSSGSSPTCCIGGASLSPRRFLCSWMREATVHEGTHGGMNRCVKKPPAIRRLVGGARAERLGIHCGCCIASVSRRLPRPASGLFGRQRRAENAAHA